MNRFENGHSISSVDHEHHPERCVFCEIVKGEAEVSIIKRDDEKKVMSIMDLRGYPLIIPTEHIEPTKESIIKNREVIVSLYDLAYQLVPHIYDEYKAEGINVIANIGEAAGMEIPHLHVHLMPRQRSDRNVRIASKSPEPRGVLDERAESLRSRLVSQAMQIDER